MTKFFRDFLRDESGAAAAEYVLILAVIGGAIAAGAYTLGTSISEGLTAKSTQIDKCVEDASSAECKG
jgi:pilus assembly protein Flp/PilA